MNFDLALMALRVALFLVFVYEGWTKLVDLKEYAKKMPGGLPMTFATGVGEFFGSIGVLTGILAQLAAWVLVLLMVGSIIFSLKWKTPFHTSKQAGWDFNFLLLIMALALALLGPGDWVLSGLWS
jgi:putative oxidoreductase